jgi:hypothetical protein
MAKQIYVRTALTNDETGARVICSIMRDGRLLRGIQKLTVWLHPLRGTAWINIESEWQGDDRQRQQLVTHLSQSDVDRLRKVGPGLFLLT